MGSRPLLSFYPLLFILPGFREFDEIIEKYDVYKVETIADSYMCVSGLPEKNGSKHARIIAQLALQMIRLAKTYSISSLPGVTVGLRVGIHSGMAHLYLLPTGSEERGVLGVGSIPVAILPSCQNVKTFALQLHKHKYSWVVKIRNTSEAVLRSQYSPWPSY